MIVFRMLAIACRLAWPHPLTPWRSPLLRWRMETYGVAGPDGGLLHADEITPGRFLRFCLRHRRAILRFLQAAARW
jgi:hypothetical protein